MHRLSQLSAVYEERLICVVVGRLDEEAVSDSCASPRRLLGLMEGRWGEEEWVFGCVG